MALSETDTIPLPPITPGVARALSPLVRRIACEGDGEEPGLNTYLVGIDEIVVIDPGPEEVSHLDVLCGCGGDRIKWIVLTNTDESHSASARTLKERTGAELIAPAGFDDADQILGEGSKINATEFCLTAFSMDKTNNLFLFVLEQERTIISGDHIEMSVPKELIEKVRPYRIKSIAPAHGQFIEDARPMFAR